MVNIRELAESDLGTTLEGEYGLPVELTDPDGVIYTTKKGSTDLLMGQILFDVSDVDLVTGETTVIDRIVSLRITSLTRVPLDGEKWAVRIPTTPSLTAVKEDFVFSPTHSQKGGASIGFIKLYPKRILQTP